MTVRWKPLIVLSGLFLVIAVMGLLAITYALPARSEDVLPKARADAKAKKYENAHIHYRRALQFDPKNVAIHEEMAEMIGHWAAENPKEHAKLWPLRSHALRDAAKYGKGRPGPRRQLLADALARDDAAEAVTWADELIAIEPKNLDANYVKALQALDRRPPDITDAKAHLAALTEGGPETVRTLWVEARMARESGDAAALDEVLGKAKSLALDPKTTSSERLARLRLRLMDIERTEDPKLIADQVAGFRDEARALASEGDPAPARIRLMGSALEQVQTRLKAVAARTPASKAEMKTLGDSLEAVAEAVYTRAIEASGTSDLRAHLAYAEHLLFRNKPDRSLEVAAKALKLPIALLPAWESVVAGLRETAVKAALEGKADDASRFERAAPFVKDLLASQNPRYAGMGHFFKGLIALERSGLTAAATGEASGENATTVDPKFRDEAVAELNRAAAALQDAPTAQALYGVALILTGEQGMGRQYLQTAYRLGGEGRLEPRYQVWAAWAILQAGYPEEAEPIVSKLLAGVAKGELPAELGPTLHLLKGEAHQARRTPDQLRAARIEFQAVAASQPITPALQIRLAQIDYQLGENQKGDDRLNKLKDDPRAGPAAARLLVMSLRDAKKLDEATKALAEARTRFPDSDELAEVDAALHTSANDPEGADRVLAEFLAKHPDRVEVAMSRARLLSGVLKKPAEARKLLAALAEKSETSGPLVQLAMLDIANRDLDGAAKTIAQVRSKWKEAAAADLLDAQLALSRQDPKAAAAHLEVALKKDPNNKVALFWKALLDEKAGAQAKASQALETILKDQPVKEIDENLSLTTAAKWALADMALQNQDLDTAIQRFGKMLSEGTSGELDRSVRWKLVTAQAGKGRLAEAKADVAKLLADPVTTHDERVRAADFYRRHGDEAACMAQLDTVLKAEPAHTGAVAYKALVLASKERPDDAATLLRAAIASKTPQPSNFYLMLAAAENLRKPADTAQARALAALTEGLAKYPAAVELVQAKSQVMALMKDPQAVAFVEGVAKANPSAEMRRVLAEVYREAGAMDKAEGVIASLLKETPKDARLATTLVSLVALQAQAAQDRGDREARKALDARLADLIRRYRAEFPNDLNFPQAEYELAMRQGNTDRARRLCDEMAKMDPGSPAGPLLLARLYSIENRADEVAKAYDEALTRSPRRSDIRLALAQANLALGKTDETLRQAKFVLDSERNDPKALLLQAQALTLQEGTAAQRAERRVEATKSLRSAIDANPKFLDAYHLLAEIRLMDNDRVRALTALREGLKIKPNDDTGLSALVQHLCENRGPGVPAPVADVQEAMKVAEEFGARDERGVFALAIAVGFQRAGKYDLALPWAEKAAKAIDRPIVHQTCGDILLARAEAVTAPGEAKELFTRAVAQYDAVLAQQPTSIEAVNNKAWVLHRYLSRNAEALELAQDFLKRSDASSLPAEFFDTLGSIQEAMNQPKKAEESYTQGVHRSPNHPTLNYHLGKLLSADASRSGEAISCLTKAQKGKARLSPEMTNEVDTLLKGLTR